MKRRSGPRKTANLSDSFHHQFEMYALAAGAAGVSFLASVQPSEAKIVYTPSHHVISSHGRYLLDLNHDGIADFMLREQIYCDTDSCQSHLIVGPVGPTRGGVGVEGRYLKSSGWGWASDLRRGSRIGPAHPFSAKLMAVALSGNTWDYLGPWGGVNNGYLGFRFRIRGQVHYGWARLSVYVKGGQSIIASLLGFAYETIPGKSIKAGQTKDAPGSFTNENVGPDASLTNPIPNAPQPATLGALAMGSPGLSIWRRKEAVLESGLHGAL